MGEKKEKKKKNKEKKDKEKKEKEKATVRSAPDGSDNYNMVAAVQCPFVNFVLGWCHRS